MFHIVFHIQHTEASNLEYLQPYNCTTITTITTTSANKDWRYGIIKMSQLTAKFVLHSTSLKGIIHLYRNRCPQYLQCEDLPGQSLVACVLAVPLWVTPEDFVKLMGQQRQNASHFTIIRDEVPNRYMLLIKFRDSKSTSTFVHEVKKIHRSLTVVLSIHSSQNYVMLYMFHQYLYTKLIFIQC
jgi:hypothetical protein